MGLTPLPDCPDCGAALRRQPASLHCDTCGYTRTGGTYQVWDPTTPAEDIAAGILAQWARDNPDPT